MEDMIKLGEGCVVSSFTHRQTGKAALVVETLVYDHQQEAMRQVVTLYHDYPGSQGYGMVVFQGTLQELVALVQEGIARQ